ncbi:FG-GAP repeat protein, partial [Singulisphaera rosea]
GGTTVTITGTGFTGTTQVFFGTTPATNVVVNSATQLTVISPAGVGTDDVTVFATGGPSAVSPADGFTYLVPSTFPITASDGTAGGGFGSSVAISGNILVVGVGSGALIDNSPGAAYVYVASGNAWNQVAKLTASDSAAGNRFGSSVAISGNTIVVGAPEAMVGSNSGQGAAYLFTLTGSSWTQATELTAGDGVAHDLFGSSVAISGNTILVGAEDATATQGTLFSPPGPGAVYVFTGAGSSWTQAARLAASDGASGNQFGESVSLSGNTAAIGAANTTYIFTGTGAGWSQEAELSPTGGAPFSGFGGSVSLSGDTVVVGAPASTVGQNSSQGMVYIFTRSGSSWSQAAALTA